MKCFVGEILMNLFELCEKIDLQKEMVVKIKNNLPDINFNMIDGQLSKLMKIDTAKDAYDYLKCYVSEDEEHIKILICNLECGCRIYEKYQEKGISDKIFFDTMKCFSRFIDECKIRTGKCFFDRGWWTYRQISMNLFRIGELEYEFKRLENENVMGIHIPSDADFRNTKVDESLNEAKEFISKYYPEYNNCKFICSSWLLSPKLTDLLDPDSNILQFQKRFDLISTKPDEKEYIEWLFQAPADTDYQKLKEDTSLQRKVKQLLLKGDNIGSGFGIMK